MNFLLVGRGSIGVKHERILRETGHAVTTVDPDPARGADYQSPPDDITDYDGLLDCTPPDVRAGWGLPTRRPIPRFVEKPLGWIPEPPPLGAVQIGFSYRWGRRLERFVNIIKRRHIYSLTIVGGQELQAWHKEDYRQVKQRYHGVVTDSLPHSIFIARWILGDLACVGSVASKLSDLDIEVEDCTAALLRGPSGEPCLLLADYLRDPRQLFAEAVTDSGVYRWEFAPKEAEEMYWRQMAAFVALCARIQQNYYPNLEDGMAIQRILNEIQEAKG